MNKINNEEKIKDSNFYLYCVRREKINDKLDNTNSNQRKNNNMFFPLFKKHQNYKTVILNDANSIDKWLKKEIILSHVKLVALDTEFDFLKVYYDPKKKCFVDTPSKYPDIIQIGTDKKCLIIQTNEGKFSPPKVFIDIMKTPKIQKWFSGFHQDLEKIQNWCVKHNITSIDFGKRVKTHYHYYEEKTAKSIRKKYNIMDIDIHNKIGLGNLCKKYLKRQMVKKFELTLSRWSRTFLELEQIEYAVDDVAVIYDLVFENVYEKERKRRVYKNLFDKRNRLRKSGKRKFVRFLTMFRRNNDFCDIKIKVTSNEFVYIEDRSKYDYKLQY
jgi:hypothetical protein